MSTETSEEILELKDNSNIQPVTAELQEVDNEAVVKVNNEISSSEEGKAEEPMDQSSVVEPAEAEVKAGILDGPKVEEIKEEHPPEAAVDNLVAESAANGPIQNGTSSTTPIQNGTSHSSKTTMAPKDNKSPNPQPGSSKTSIKYDKNNKKPEMVFNSGDYNYNEDETLFTLKDIPLPFEDVRQFENGIELRPLGEQRYVVDQMQQAFEILRAEGKRIQGHLRALNARAGRIRKQIDREEAAIEHGIDPTLVPRSSKGLNEDEVIPIALVKKIKRGKALDNKANKKKKGNKKKPIKKAEASDESEDEPVANGGRMLKLPQAETS